MVVDYICGGFDCGMTFFFLNWHITLEGSR
jgi:hypothetical protein